MDRVSLITKILMIIIDCSYNEANNVVKQTDTYYKIRHGDERTLSKSLQANVKKIGQELRVKGFEIGRLLSDENINRAMKILKYSLV